MSENIDFVQKIVTWLEDNQIFLGERKSNEKAGSFVHVSHEAVRGWYQTGSVLFEGSTEKKRRNWIAVDEKVIGKYTRESMAFVIG